MKRTPHLFALAAAAIMLATACGTDKKPCNTTAYTDDYQRQVQIPATPRHIVSLSPAVTEIMYAIGADTLLVGRTEFCTYPPEATQIENIGGISNLNVEKVVSLHPDLVISGSMVPQKAVDMLDKMGVPIVFVLEKKTFDGLYANIGAIGQLTCHSSEATALCDSLRQRLAAIADGNARNAKSHKPTLYYVVGFGSSGNFTAGGNSFINDLLTLAGGRNVAEEIDGWSYSVEKLVADDPDYVVIRREDSAAFCTTHPYTMLTAVKERRVIAIESGTIDLQVPRNLDAIEYIHHAITTPHD